MKCTAPRSFVGAAKTGISSRELASRYGVDRRTVEKWKTLLGLTRQVKPRAPARRTFQATSERMVWEDSVVGRAARFLAHYGPVYRCDVRGVALADGFFWNRNGFVLTDDDLIQRATRLGWEAHRLAA